LTAIPQGSTLGPVLLNVFINDLSDNINYSKFLLFADNLKVYRNIKFIQRYKILQADTEVVKQWCGENCMEISVQKNKIIYFTHKNDNVHFKNYIKDISISRRNSTKDLGVIPKSKMGFHCHVDFVYFQALRTLGLIRYITYNLSP
jgi:hypothetical protein